MPADRRLQALQRQQSFTLLSVLLLASIALNIVLGIGTWRLSSGRFLSSLSSSSEDSWKHWAVAHSAWIDGGFKISLGVSLLILAQLMKITFQDSYGQSRHARIQPIVAHGDSETVVQIGSSSAHQPRKTPLSPLAFVPRDMQQSTKKLLRHAVAVKKRQKSGDKLD